VAFDLKALAPENVFPDAEIPDAHVSLAEFVKRRCRSGFSRDAFCDDLKKYRG
jgi:hypothetical protein